MSPDPKMPSLKHLLNPQKWNKYAYTLNNPLRYVDPDGLEEMDIQVRAFIFQQSAGGPGLAVFETWVSTMLHCEKVVTSQSSAYGHSIRLIGLAPSPGRHKRGSCSSATVRALPPIPVSRGVMQVAKLLHPFPRRPDVEVIVSGLPDALGAGLKQIGLRLAAAPALLGQHPPCKPQLQSLDCGR